MADEDDRNGQLDWGAAGFALALLAGIVAFLPLPLWATVAAALWLLLSATALLGLLDAASRKHIARQLTEARFTQAYRFTVSRQLGLIWRRFCDPVAEEAGLIPTFRAALTWRLYDAALLIAVAYPILLLVGWWILGFDGRLGSVLILPAAPVWPDRAVALLSIAFVLGAVFLRQLPKRWKMREVHVLLDLLPFLAIALAFLVSGLVAIAMIPLWIRSGFLAQFFNFVFVLMFIFISLSALHFFPNFGYRFDLSYYFIWSFSLFLPAVIVFRLFNSNLTFGGVSHILLCVALGFWWVFSAHTLPWQSFGLFGFVIVFLSFLPLLNALFDVLSYAVTLTLMRRGLRARQPLLYGLADLLVAGLLFLALGATLTAVIAGLNRLAGTPLLDLGSLFAGIHTSPGDYWWLYAMVFSTLLPTLLHGALSLLGAQALAPLRLRRPVARLVAGAPHTAWKAAAAPLALGTVWALPFAGLAGLLYLLWWIARDALALYAGAYLDALTRLAIMVNAF